MTRKFNILVFQNCFSYFHWNVERESRRLWTVSFSSDQLFFEQEMMRGAYTPGTPLCDASFSSLNDRAVQTDLVFFRDVCYISSKSWDFPLFRNAKLVFIGMSSKNLQKNEVKTFQRPIPEMNRLKFPKYDPKYDFTILQRVANKLFRNESYMIRKYNIVAFQNCFSYFHWNVERESRRLWTFSFSSDQLFFEQEMTPGAYNTPGTPLWDTSL